MTHDLTASDMAHLIRLGLAHDPPKVYVAGYQVAEALGHERAVLWAADVAELASDRWSDERPAALLEAARLWANCPCDEHAAEASVLGQVRVFGSAHLSASLVARASSSDSRAWATTIGQAVSRAVLATAVLRGQDEGLIVDHMRLAADRLEAL